jgi:hypothetical protein
MTTGPTLYRWDLSRVPHTDFPRLREIERLKVEILRDYDDALSRGAGKWCNWCHQLKPPTPEYFHRSARQPDGLGSYCKACRSAYMNEYRREWPGTFRRYRQQYYHSNLVIRRFFEEGGTPFVPKAKEKRCSRCGEVKPLTREFFHRDLGRPNGFNSYCKACRSKARG